MKDSLDEFVKQNREAFDHRVPSDKVWTNIRVGLGTTGGLWNSVVVWRVAAALLLGLSAYLFVSKPAVVKSSEVVQIQGEFTDAELFYTDQIAEKVALIEDFENGYEDDAFTQDLQKLDAMYQVLREEMKAKPSAKVKDALVLNMIIRIDLLNQQIKKLEDANRAKGGSVSI